MINWERVNELRDEIGDEDFAEVAELFLSEVEEVMARLRAGPPDPERLEEDMHFLKGSALNLGFEAMSQLCLEGERAAAAGRPGDVALDRVLSVYARSKARFLENRP